MPKFNLSSGSTDESFWLKGVYKDGIFLIPSCKFHVVMKLSYVNDMNM